MANDREREQLRKLKRVLKRAGSKHRRREFKRQLAENPEEAAYQEENLGRHRSEYLNGLDRDATRRRPGEFPTLGSDTAEEAMLTEETESSESPDPAEDAGDSREAAS